MRDGVCLFQRRVWNGAERAGAAVPVERSLGTGLHELFSGEGLAFYVKCVSGRLCANCLRGLGGVVGMVLVKSGLIRGGFYHILDDYDGVVNVRRVWQSECCVLREWRAHAGQQLGAQKKLVSSFVLIRRESDGNEAMWVERVPLLFWCFIKGRDEGEELAV